MLVALWIGLMSLGADRPEPPAPIAWSPDGVWIAYVQDVRPFGRPTPDGWLFRAGLPVTSLPNPLAAATAYRLWATRPETGESVLLDESRGPISAPAWSKDGSGVAYSRVTRGSDGSAALELVAQDSPDRRKVLHREILKGPEPSAKAIRTLAPAWSPDGKMIAVPRLEPAGLIIVRVDGGRVDRIIDGASAPAWCPIDNRLAYFTSGANRGLWVLDGVLAEPRKIAERFELLDVPPPPAWERDGRAILMLRPTTSASNAGARGRGGLFFHVARVRTDGREADSVVELTHDPVASEGSLAGVWFSIAPDADDAFYATAEVGQPTSQLTWTGRRFSEVRKRFNPFDESTLLGAISAAPEDRGVAFRVWSDGSWSPPAICRPTDEAMTLAAADEMSRADWIGRVLAAIGPVLTERIPAPTLIDQTPVDRPNLLPVPGELPPNDSTAIRLLRLAKMGTKSLGPPTVESAETRLALAYLAGEARQAEDALAILQERADSPAQRLRLLAIHAQIQLMRGDFATAERQIDYLRSARIGPSFEVEDFLETRRISRLDDPGVEWARFLGERLKALRKPSTEPDPDLVPRDALDLEGVRGRGADVRPAAPF